MYGERFYGDEVLFGLSEVIYFAGAVILGDGVALAAPVLLNVTQAQSVGNTSIRTEPVLSTFVAIAVAGHASGVATGVFITPTTGALDGGSALSTSVGYLVYPRTAAAVGDTTIPTPNGVLIFAPNASLTGETTTTVAPVLWLYPSGAFNGNAVVAAVAVHITPTGANPVGAGVVSANGCTVSITSGALAGDTSFAVDSVLRLVGSANLTGDATVSVPVGILIGVRTAPLVGAATTTVQPVLRDVRTGLVVGDTSFNTPVAVLRCVRTAALVGEANASAGTVLRDVRSAALVGETTLTQPPPILVLIAVVTAALSGDGRLNAPSWFLWNEDMTQILASSGSVVYTTDGQGVVVATFTNLPDLRGETTISLDITGRVIDGASFYTVLDPSRTGVDAGGYANVGVVVTQ